MNMSAEEFRAAELLERTGIPRTTLHYYLREGLLPPPRKTSPNSAWYSPAHVERIRILQRLRSEEFGSLPVARIRRVIDRLDKGVSVDVAVQMEGLMGLPVADDERYPSLSALGERFGVPLSTLETLVRLGLLIRDPFGREPGYGALEGRIARALHGIVEETPLKLEDLAPIARLATEAARLEMRLRDRAVEGLRAGEETATATLRLLRAAELLHPYLRSRSAEREIAARRGRASLALRKPS